MIARSYDAGNQQSFAKLYDSTYFGLNKRALRVRYPCVVESTRSGRGCLCPNASDESAISTAGGTHHEVPVLILQCGLAGLCHDGGTSAGFRWQPSQSDQFYPGRGTDRKWYFVRAGSQWSGRSGRLGYGHAPLRERLSNSLHGQSGSVFLREFTGRKLPD